MFNREIDSLSKLRTQEVKELRKQHRKSAKTLLEFFLSTVNFYIFYHLQAPFSRFLLKHSNISLLIISEMEIPNFSKNIILLWWFSELCKILDQTNTLNQVIVWIEKNIAIVSGQIQSYFENIRISTFFGARWFPPKNFK